MEKHRRACVRGSLSAFLPNPETALTRRSSPPCTTALTPKRRLHLLSSLSSMSCAPVTWESTTLYVGFPAFCATLQASRQISAAQRSQGIPQQPSQRAGPKSARSYAVSPDRAHSTASSPILLRIHHGMYKINKYDQTLHVWKRCLFYVWGCFGGPHVGRCGSPMECLGCMLLDPRTCKPHPAGLLARGAGVFGLSLGTRLDMCASPGKASHSCVKDKHRHKSCGTHMKPQRSSKAAAGPSTQPYEMEVRMWRMRAR